MSEHAGHLRGQESATHNEHRGDGKRATIVLHTGGLNWASEKAVVEAVLGRRRGVQEVEANPAAQTATVTYDTEQTSVAALRLWVEECGLQCAGQSVPTHMCDPMQEPDPNGHVGHGPASVIEAPPGHEAHRPEWRPEHETHFATSAGALAEGHIGHGMPMQKAGHEVGAEAMPSPHEMMGHDGPAGRSMDAMVRDMRNRFLVAALLSIPILLWSPIGRDVLNFRASAPLGLRDDAGCCCSASR